MAGGTNIQTLLDAVAARERLRANPTIERVAFGLKEKNGEVLPEYVFRLYVREKKPPGALSRGETIPPEIDGIKTDVLVQSYTVPVCRKVLTPGKQITRDVPNWSDGPGTLGCVVRNASSVYILSCQHVIVPPAGGSASADVYQPKRSTCAEIDCNSPVAKVVAETVPWAVKEIRTLDGKDYVLDCGLVKIDDGIAFSNIVEDLGAINTTIRDLAIEATKTTGTPGHPGPAHAACRSQARHENGRHPRHGGRILP